MTKSEYIKEWQQDARLKSLELRFEQFSSLLNFRLKNIAEAFGVTVRLQEPVIDENVLMRDSEASWLHGFNKQHETIQNFRIGKMQKRMKFLFDQISKMDEIFRDNSLNTNNQASKSNINSNIYSALRFLEDHSRSGINSFAQSSQNRKITQIENNLNQLDEALKGFDNMLSAALVNEVKEQNFNGAERLLKCGAVPSYAYQGVSALEIAYNNHDEGLRNLLIDYSGEKDLNSRFSNGKTLMHLAAERNDCDLINRLIDKGANPNQVIFKPVTFSLSFLGIFETIGDTPLKISFEKGYNDIANSLIRYGAKQNIIGNNGYTAEELIAKNSNGITLFEGNQQGTGIKVEPIVYLGIGYSASKFFIVPAIKCTNSDNYSWKNKAKTHYYTFSECYKDKFDKDHFINSLKAPAVSLALYTINPAAVLATPIALSLLDSYYSEKEFSLTQIGSSIIKSALFSPIVSLDPLYKFHPVIYGATLPLMEYGLESLIGSFLNHS